MELYGSPDLTLTIIHKSRCAGSRGNHEPLWLCVYYCAQEIFDISDGKRFIYGRWMRSFILHVCECVFHAVSRTATANITHHSYTLIPGAVVPCIETASENKSFI